MKFQTKRNVILRYDDDEFQVLKKKKAKTEEELKSRVSWEAFVFRMVCGK